MPHAISAGFCPRDQPVIGGVAPPHPTSVDHLDNWSRDGGARTSPRVEFVRAAPPELSRAGPAAAVSGAGKHEASLTVGAWDGHPGTRERAVVSRAKHRPIATKAAFLQACVDLTWSVACNEDGVARRMPRGIASATYRFRQPTRQRSTPSVSISPACAERDRGSLLAGPQNRSSSDRSPLLHAFGPLIPEWTNKAPCGPSAAHNLKPAVSAAWSSSTDQRGRHPSTAAGLCDGLRPSDPSTISLVAPPSRITPTTPLPDIRRLEQQPDTRCSDQTRHALLGSRPGGDRGARRRPRQPRRLAEARRR